MPFAIKWLVFSCNLGLENHSSISRSIPWISVGNCMEASSYHFLKIEANV